MDVFSKKCPVVSNSYFHSCNLPGALALIHKGFPIINPEDERVLRNTYKKLHFAKSGLYSTVNNQFYKFALTDVSIEM